MGPNAPSQSLSYESLEQSYITPEEVQDDEEIIEDTQRVIRDRETFESFWRRLHPNTESEVPEIDFSQKIVLAAVLPRRPTTGYRADIANITKDMHPTVVSVFVTEIEPGSNCDVEETETLPYHVVSMDTVSTDQIEFQDNGTQTEECTS